MDVCSFLEEKLEKIQATSFTSNHEDGGPKGVGGERISALRKEEDGRLLRGHFRRLSSSGVFPSPSLLSMFSPLWSVCLACSRVVASKMVGGLCMTVVVGFCLLSSF